MGKELIKKNYRKWKTFERQIEENSKKTRWYLKLRVYVFVTNLPVEMEIQPEKALRS